MLLDAPIVARLLSKKPVSALFRIEISILIAVIPNTDIHLDRVTIIVTQVYTNGGWIWGIGPFFEQHLRLV